MKTTNYELSKKLFEIGFKPTKKYRHGESGEIVEVKPISKEITKTFYLTDQYYSVVSFTEDKKRKTSFITEDQFNKFYEEVENENL